MEIIEIAGLNVYIGGQPVHRGFSWSTQTHPGFWFGTMLKGRVTVEQPCIGCCDWSAGASTRFQSEGQAETRHLALEDGEVSGVFVHIAHDDIEAIAGPEGVAELCRSKHPVRPITPADWGTAAKTIQAIAWQMFGCTLSGASRRLYLGGKAMEMIAYLSQAGGDGREPVQGVGQGESSPAGARSARSWRPSDIECFYEARSILLKRLDDPPSVPELAQSVGTNARKLGQGFVDLFGEPVYSFVKTRRLEGARQMIEAGETSIARVAYAFGYNPGHFATEFRKRFGVSPTALTGRRGAPSPGDLD